MLEMWEEVGGCGFMWCHECSSEEWRCRCVGDQRTKAVRWRPAVGVWKRWGKNSEGVHVEVKWGEMESDVSMCSRCPSGEVGNRSCGGGWGLQGEQQPWHEEGGGGGEESVFKVSTQWHTHAYRHENVLCACVGSSGSCEAPVGGVGR